MNTRTIQRIRMAVAAAFMEKLGLGESVHTYPHQLNEALYVGDRVIGLSQYWNWRDGGHGVV